MNHHDDVAHLIRTSLSGEHLPVADADAVRHRSRRRTRRRLQVATVLGVALASTSIVLAMRGPSRSTTVTTTVAGPSTTQPTATQPTATEPAAPACRASALGVTVDADLTIRVTNRSDLTCSITGTPPVSMLVGRVEGPDPTRSTVVLPPGAAFVQPQVLVPGATACEQPISAGMGDPPFSVTVAGVLRRVPNDVGAAVRHVVNCDVVTRPPGHVET